MTKKIVIISGIIALAAVAAAGVAYFLINKTDLIRDCDDWLDDEEICCKLSEILFPPLCTGRKHFVKRSVKIWQRKQKPTQCVCLTSLR